MQKFFSIYNENHDPFLIFSPLHLQILAALCGVVLSIIIFKKNMRKRADIYRYLIAITALVLECSFLVWLVSAGKWNIKSSLPFELCEITFILCIIMLIKQSYRLFVIVYFWGFIGSTLALLFPNLHTSYRQFPFWAFILTHSLNIISLVFMISVEKYRPTRKSIWVAFGMSNIYMVFITIVNHLLGSNYFYYYVLKQPAPNILNPLAYTHSWVVKILLLEVISLIALLICYLPFTLTNIFKKTPNPEVH